MADPASGPWLKYAAPEQKPGPWAKYAAPQPAAQPAPARDTATMGDVPLLSKPLGQYQLTGQDELGQPIYKDANTGRVVTVTQGPDRQPDGRSTGQRVLDTALSLPGAIAGGIAQGLQAPGKAARGEMTTFGDAVATGSLAASGVPAIKPPNAAVQAGKDAGIRIMTTDVIPPKTFIGKFAQRVGEAIPIAGTGGIRAAQEVQRLDAVKNAMREFGVPDPLDAGIIGPVASDLLAKRSATISRYSDMKTEVIDRVSGAGPVPVPNATAAIDAQIADLASLRTQAVAPVIRALEDWKQAIQSQPLVNIEKLRKQIGEAFKDPALTAIRSTGEKALAAVYGPLRRDMGEFIKANGQPRDLQKWQIANSRLADGMSELNVSVLKRVLAKGEATPEIVRQMLFSAKPSDVRLLYRQLTPEGRAAAKTAILGEAVMRAGGWENITPRKFNTNLQKFGSQIGVFFTGKDLQAIEGLQLALKATQRASEAGVSTATGVQLLPVAGASALTSAFGMGGAAGTALGIGLTARLYESAAVRDILLKFPKVRPGSPSEAVLLRELALAVEKERESK